MTVVTRKRSGNFAVIPNHVADDARLSFEARGVLVYLLAKPHDWQVRVPDIQRAGGIGRDKVQRILNELIVAGYIMREQDRRPDGTMGPIEYVVYDDPVPGALPLAPQPEKPVAASPRPENQAAVAPRPGLPEPAGPRAANQAALIRTEESQKTESTKNPAAAGFAALWSAWRDRQKPDDRPRAEAMFLNLPAEIDRDKALELSTLYQSIQILRGNKPNLIGYLKARAWRDLIDAPPVDRDGDFIITPDRDEWPEWLEAIRAVHGEVGVAHSRKTGRILRKDRWPPAAQPQLAMQMA